MQENEMQMKQAVIDQMASLGWLFKQNDVMMMNGVDGGGDDVEVNSPVVLVSMPSHYWLPSSYLPHPRTVCWSAYSLPWNGYKFSSSLPPQWLGLYHEGVPVDVGVMLCSPNLEGFVGNQMTSSCFFPRKCKLLSVYHSARRQIC